MPSELESCPKCGALPCDWTDNPHEPATPAGDEALVEELEDVGFGWLQDNEREAVLAVIHRREAAAHDAGEAKGRADETGWLIEHSDEPKWLTLRPGEACFEVCWTKASLEALRFARRTDAEDYVSTYFGGDGPIRITEHRWCDAIERAQHERPET